MTMAATLTRRLTVQAAASDAPLSERAVLE